MGQIYEMEKGVVICVDSLRISQMEMTKGISLTRLPTRGSDLYAEIYPE